MTRPCSCVASCSHGPAATPAGALIRAGSLRPAAQVADADDRTLDLRAINGRPILVLYEDKDSAKVNEP